MFSVSPGKSEAVGITGARVKDPLNHSFGNQRIPEASSCKYLGTIVRSELSWPDQVTQYKNPGRHFIS
jgi:hypothetical protein